MKVFLSLIWKKKQKKLREGGHNWTTFMSDLHHAAREFLAQVLHLL